MNSLLTGLRRRPRLIAFIAIVAVVLLFFASKSGRTKRVIAATGAQGAGVVTAFAGPQWLANMLDHVPPVKSLLETRPVCIVYFEATDSDSEPIDLSYLKDAPFVESLHASGIPGITDRDLGFIGQLKRLYLLRLEGQGITDEGMRRLSELQELAGLSIENGAFTDDGLTCLAGMPNLTDLALGGNTAFTGEGLRHLPDHCRLQSLYVAGTSFDHGLDQIDVSSLEVLHADRTPLSDAGLVPLRDAHALEQLTIAKTGVTDDGLLHLAALDNLEILIVSGTLVTQAGAERLAAQLPRVTIVYGPTNRDEWQWAYGSEARPESDETITAEPATTD